MRRQNGHRYYPGRDERDLNSAETFQEKLSKGFRDIFGGHKKSAEEDMEEKKLRRMKSRMRFPQALRM